MQARIDPKRVTRSPRAPLLALAILATGILPAGCGASSPSPTAATVASHTTSRSTARGAGGSGPLAFADCMRSHGVPKFPDPNPRGGFQVGAGVDPTSPAFKAAQAKCQKLMGGPAGGPPSLGSTTHPTAQTLAKLLKIARCMRQHGVSAFPDPRTSVPSNPSGIQEITDFDGVILLFPSTINLQAPAYKQALAACGAPPLGLPH